MERNTARVQGENVMRNYVGDPSKLGFIFSEILFRLFEVLDVNACSVPSDDFGGLVA
jgi:hypothetical protein